MTTAGPAVFRASDRVADWPEVRARLMAAFELSQEAARQRRSIVYVVHGEDLLGRRGAPSAMMATGLLSAARTAAIELRGTQVNVLAVGDSTDEETVEAWIRHLAAPGGPTGEIIRLDPAHLGKALP